MKQKIKNLFIQIIPVMIGVYLGFLISDWSENQKLIKQRQILIASMLSEIETNQQNLAKLIDYHRMLLDSSRFYAKSEISLQQSNFIKGTRMTKLPNSAYNTGIQTGIINELPITTIQLINRLYTFQND